MQISTKLTHRVVRERDVAAPHTDGHASIRASRGRPAWRPEGAVHAAVVVLLLSICAALVIDSIRDDAGTSDEFDHLVSGYALLRNVDLEARLWDPVGTFVEQPPLIKTLAGLPLLFLPVRLPEPTLFDRPPLANNYFYGSPDNDPDRLLWWGRIAMLPLLLLLAVLVMWWAQRVYGAGAGLLALFLTVFNTVLLGNGRFVMIDLGLALFYALAVYLFLRDLEGPSAAKVVLAGVAFGLAQVSKFSALALVPTFLVIAVFHVMRSHHVGLWATWSRRMPAMLARVVAIWVIGGLVVAAVYQLEVWAASPDRQARLTQRFLGAPGRASEAAVVTGLTSVSRGLGYYALGLAVLRHHNVRGHPSFLFGRIAPNHQWTYFPTAFLLKTQLALIVLAVIAAFVTRHDAQQRFESHMLLVAVAIYALAALAARIDIGVRHLLPIYPLLIVWTSQTMRWVTARRGPLKTVTVGVLAAWYVLTVIAVHPHYVASFNELAGGPAGGSAYLSDSNVDLGQDMKRLGTYLRDAGISDVAVLCAAESSNLWPCREVRHYIPWATPWDPQLPDGPPPSGFVAAGKTPLALINESMRRADPVARQRWDDVKALLQRTAPLHTVGYSLDLYYLQPGQMSR